MKKLTYEHVKEKFEERGYTLLSNEYKNNRSKLDCLCSAGHKHSITYRDFMCLNPACRRKDNVLSIHHINYNKKDCRPKNLITVCRSCNSIANFDREWHEAWYKAIIKRRYLHASGNQVGSI